MTDEPTQHGDREARADSDGPVRAEYDWTTIRPTTAVVETVERTHDGTTGPLYETLDPDGLNVLIRSAAASEHGSTTTVSFEFVDRAITVHSSGEIVVRTNSWDS